MLGGTEPQDRVPGAFDVEPAGALGPARDIETIEQDALLVGRSTRTIFVNGFARFRCELRAGASVAVDLLGILHLIHTSWRSSALQG